MIESPKGYKKYIYWLSQQKEKELRLRLIERGEGVIKGKAVVCKGLTKASGVVSVSPAVWNEICRRQGSWYRKSEKNRQYLIISPYQLEGFEDYREAVITESDFLLPRPATIQEKQEIVEDHEFIQSVPQEWYDATELEKRVWMRWARRLGSDKDWDGLFLVHTANHANFIKPRFFIESNGQKIPYSIDKSADLCSCCLEIFQVIGDRFPQKLIVPCVGAVMFAGLPKDRYLLVEKPDC